MQRTDLSLLLAAALGLGVVVAGAQRGGIVPVARHAPLERLVPGDITEGSLVRTDPYGKHTGELCPLKHTSVEASVSGFLARVTVTQDFENTTADKIEAVYTFPLPHLAAVDDMTMQVGSRTVKGTIKRRAEARQIYEQARNNGRVASLLEQQRPNIFTQSVANIEPGAKVRVVISYVETLKFEEGVYEFSFPMTVGPRYTPASMDAGDAAAVVPKYAPPMTRAGHDLSLKVALDAGVAVNGITCRSHEISADRQGASRAVITLKEMNTIPNKDFVLRYAVGAKTVSDAMLTHRGGRGGFFSLILQPPERLTVEDVTPKELVFVLDTSGSMSGFPIEKAKETMRMALAGLYPRDTFNLITFAGDTRILFPRPVSATPENLRLAREFLDGSHGGGGTEMMKAIRASLDGAGETSAVRIVCFMTDGYVGNDQEIIREIRTHPSARVFSFGIGGSVNRFLLDGMAEAGRGEVEYVALNDDGSAAARRFHERVRNPLLTDVTVDWHGLPVSEVYPTRPGDLFAAKPLVIHGRYSGATTGTVTLRGRMSGREFRRDISVNLPASQPANDVLATMWARTRIADLSAHNGSEGEITQLGLDYRLMTQFTSFVAVEETTVTREGKTVRVEVPVEMPEGVSHQGVFGDAARMEKRAQYAAMPASKGMLPSGTPGGVVGGIISQERSQVFSNQPQSAPPPPPPPPAPARMRVDSLGKLDAAARQMLDKEADHTRKVEVEIWLSDWTTEIEAQLKALGFEQSEPARVAKIRKGRIRLDQLEKLAKLEAVLNVRPVQ